MGNSTGPGAPSVSGPGFSGYTIPANWTSPAVSGRDLIVHTNTLRSVASTIGGLATTLQDTLSSWQSNAANAMSGTAAGTWPAAQALTSVINRAFSGVQQFTGDLHKAHSDMQTRLTQSADRYDAAEQHVTSIANTATDPTATIIGAGGNNTPTVPTAAQARALAMQHHMDPGGSGQNWQQTLPVAEGASCDATAPSGYTWDIVRSQVMAADPAAISAAGTAYLNMYNALTQVAGVLPGQGATLAADWGGTTAVTAVSQVQQLHQTASDMQANTYAAGTALTWYGQVLSAFQNNLPASGSTPTSGPHAAAANQAAQQYMQALSQHTQTAFYNMPGAVNKNLPPPLTTTGGSGTSGGASYGGANGGASGGAGGAGGGYSGGAAPSVAPPGSVGTVPGVTTPGGTVPGGTGPGTPPGVISPAPTRLAGVGPVGTVPPAPVVPPAPGGLGTPPPVVTPPGGPGPGVGVLPPPVIPGGPGGVGSVPGGLGSVPGGAGPVPGGEPGPVDLGVPPPGITEPVPGSVPGISPAGVITGQSGPGSLASQEGLAASGDAAAAGDAVGGQGMMPMMGGAPGGAGQGGAGRLRESWAAEEQGTWGPEAPAGGATDGAGVAADGAGPGMMPVGAGGGRGQERDRNRLVWMSEEDDLWGAWQPAIPPVISEN